MYCFRVRGGRRLGVRHNAVENGLSLAKAPVLLSDTFDCEPGMDGDCASAVAS